MAFKDSSVDYGFGQLGSAYTASAASIIPPKGMVIVAIQFLADNTLTVLRSEKKTNALIENAEKTSFFSTTYVAHNNGEAQQACVNNGSPSTEVTLTAANSAIKVGMQAFSNTADILQDATANLKPCLVTSVNEENIRLSRPIVCATTTLTFSELNGTGDGGEAVSGVVFPKGLTVYGRWVEVKPAADADGGIICYFGF
jgi:hypothetical protein